MNMAKKHKTEDWVIQKFKCDRLAVEKTVITDIMSPDRERGANGACDFTFNVGFEKIACDVTEIVPFSGYINKNIRTKQLGDLIIKGIGINNDRYSIVIAINVHGFVDRYQSQLMRYIIALNEQLSLLIKGDKSLSDNVIVLEGVETLIDMHVSRRPNISVCGLTNSEERSSFESEVRRSVMKKVGQLNKYGLNGYKKFVLMHNRDMNFLNENIMMSAINQIYERCELDQIWYINALESYEVFFPMWIKGEPETGIFDLFWKYKEYAQQVDAPEPASPAR